MFKKIYGKINRMMWRLQIWLHFHEELREASRNFRLKNEKALKEEIADTFAWLIAFCNKNSFNLAELIWENYPGKCNVCKKEKCQCPKV